MNDRSQALEFAKVTFYIERERDSICGNAQPIRSMKELRDTLNQLDLDDEDFGIYLTGKTEDDHVAHFRFYNKTKENTPWYWGYVQFVLEKLDSKAERILQTIKDVLNGSN